jgi:alpha-L-fucosidase
LLNLKNVPEPVWSALTRDFEMSLDDALRENPWQTEACIGEWHYRRSLFENHTYKKASLIIPMLVDIVSKNGNLLLNIPLPGDGEPDTDELAFLGELADWQQINSEAIRGTRLWKIYGEGPSTHAGKAPAYQIDRLAFGPQDIRFTTKGDTLFAIALGWPNDGTWKIASLAEGSPHHPHPIAKVELVGSKAPVRWTRTPDALEIRVMDPPPCKHAYTLRIPPRIIPSVPRGPRKRMERQRGLLPLAAPVRNFQQNCWC